MTIELKTFTTLASVLTNSRRILVTLTQSNLADQHRQMVDEALDLVRDIADRMLEIQSAAVELKDENETLKRALADTEDWNTRIAPYQLHKNEVGGVVLKSETPFPHVICSVCAESKHEIHPLQPGSEYSAHDSCPACRTTYDVRKARPLPVGRAYT